MSDPSSTPTPVPASPAAPAMPMHCWAEVLDHGGQVPIYMPVHPTLQPTRFIATTRGEALKLHFQCCKCGQRGTREFKSQARATTAGGKAVHGPHRAHFDIPEVAPLADGPCPNG